MIMTKMCNPKSIDIIKNEDMDGVCKGFYKALSAPTTTTTLTTNMSVMNYLRAMQKQESAMQVTFSKANIHDDNQNLQFCKWVKLIQFSLCEINHYHGTSIN